MTFAVYMPACAATAAVPVIYYLSGLTCTDENFSQKGGFGRAASTRGVCLVMPDTSPRGITIDGADDSYDFGSGAGFYVDATEAKWSGHYKMYTYVTKELPALIQTQFAGKVLDKKAIFGHSMGGHGALTIFLKNPGAYTSVSAFAPICNPTKCPWGVKAFSGYLGSVDAGKAHDATELVLGLSSPPSSAILIDQGMGDNFYCGEVNQLQPAAFMEACEAKGVKLSLRYQEGYDHSYFFISSFVDDHINFHADNFATC
uniref:S-formylglutathione hydrolase n=1 Tax=Calcidiscus leptoporus TaxID=127549 RepID=A0A7S0JBA3_9EUKA